MSAIRVTLIFASAFLWLGFYLSNWQIHWITYIPAIMLAVAGIVGFCPSTWFFGKIGFKPTNLKN